MTKFGKTWYGNLWLYSQEDYFYSNRFSRGQSYAKNNHVFDLKFNKNSITAKVKGVYQSYYNVSITFEQFTDYEKETIINTIKSNPQYLAAFLNNKFSSDLFLDLEKADVDLIKILYSQDCNCYDFYGEPCKHIAALIYEAALEFDKDPLKLFELQGLDLRKEFDIEKTEETSTVFQFFKKDTKDYGISKFKQLNFSLIPKLEVETFSMLDENPIFYDKDFKEILRKFYRSFKRYDKKFMTISNDEYEHYMLVDNKYKKSEDFNENFNNKWDVKNWNKINIDLNNKFLIEFIDVGNDDLFNFDYEEYLVSFLAEFTHYSNINDYNDDIKFLYQLFNFTRELIKKEAIVPCLYKSNKSYIIRWMPAIYNSKVRTIVEMLYEMAPEDIVTYNGKKLSKKQTVLALTSILIHGILAFYLDDGITIQLSKNYDHPIFDIFMGFTREFKKKYSEYEILLHQWISTLSFRYKNHDVVFEFQDEEDYISLDLKFNNKRVYDIIQENDNDRNSVLKELYLIEKYLPQITQLIETGDLLKLNLEEFIKFLEDIMPIFDMMGITVLLPNSIHKQVKPKLALTTNNPVIVNNYLSKDNISSFNWEVAIGENIVSADEFKKLVKSSEKIVKIANNYVILDKDETDKFLKKLEKVQDIDEFIVMQTLLTGEFEDVEVNIDSQLKTMFEDMIRFDEISVPKNVNATLRDYQKDGFSWLVQNINNGFGSILADDMGLGKTLQTLTTIQYFKQQELINEKKVLIVMPNGLLLNWMREIEKFTPDIKAEIYHGANREFPQEDFDILLTSYGVLRSDKDILNEHNWFLMVIDEAQNIKNHGTKQSRAVKEINADNKIALSGTPVENRLSEYWSIFDFTNPHYLPGSKKFTNDYIKPIELLRDKDTLKKFKTITDPFILRRLKTDKNIIDDLPDKIVNDVYCNLTPKQAAIYQETLDTLMDVISQEEDVNRRGIILKLITSLKQICNHPAQFLKSKGFKIDQSGKMEVLMGILDNILANNEKVIIFTQYVQMGEIIKKLVEKKFETKVGFLHGSLNKEDKDKVVHDFEDDDDCKILLASLKTGGTGLNLTVAQNVIHYDLWWNPAVENQATDRAYRIGQTKNVMVYRLITSGTFEERINDMLKDKEELADLTVSTNRTFVTELDDEELANLLKLRK